MCPTLSIEMIYEQWRDALFNNPPKSDPYSHSFPEAFFAVPPERAFDFIDRVLVDPDMHHLFSKDQLGNGIHIIYSSGLSDLPFLYTTECDEDRRIVGLGNLINLYRNYFERYCTGAVNSIGNDQTDGTMGFICYMLWDVFVLHPGNVTPRMTSAAIDVMRLALESQNDNCLASAIHGLGHWGCYATEAVVVLENWLRNPTTRNPEILQYARAATSGMIL
jgi:hypothetical protein